MPSGCLAVLAQPSEGTDARSDNRRPQFDALITTVMASDRTRPKVCVVQAWGRLSLDPAARLDFMRRIKAAGARVETSLGETTDPAITVLMQRRAAAAVP